MLVKRNPENTTPEPVPDNSTAIAIPKISAGLQIAVEDLDDESEAEQTYPEQEHQIPKILAKNVEDMIELALGNTQPSVLGLRFLE